MSAPEQPQLPPQAAGGGVIHDIGYRHYDGPRLGTRYVQRSLFVDGLRGAYGLGRSMRSKIMPLLLLAAMCLPAIVLVVVTTVVGGDDLPLGYTEYLFNVQTVVAIFLAAQAPVLVSRDLRYRVVPLYFARPLQRPQYVQAKLAAMTTALFVLMALPLVIMFAGALLAKIPFSEQAPDLALGLLAALLYAVVLAGVGLLIAAFTPRRGLGVAAVIAVLLVLSGAQVAVWAIADELGNTTLAGLSGLISPSTLVDGVLSSVLGASSTVVEPPGTLGAVVFVAAAVLLVVGCYLALLARYRRVPTS
ncbi:ABC transporter permease [uncultured Cellulomonas sp.]|uniref:ABC transporter permease n=1 Tax=uncultured Cellulomonas sp. TaxID=189682 RepID=UPI00262E3B17|nr:ABC transporter permease [uncultured Cellulomonas sp.]